MKLFIALIFGLAIVSGQAQESKPIIVVELFTSEGCSSCPPADRLLSEIVNKDYEGVEVIGLSFHVDYWDYIGWKDPYASRDYTLRQRAYGRKFGLSSIYTPQMIVNGKHEFVGSSRAKWNHALNSESVPKNYSDLIVEVVSISDSELRFRVRSNEMNSSLLNVAIVEKSLSQQVDRGENRGRKLSHDNVVRAYDSRSFDGKPNSFLLTIPSNLKPENASLIVYAQKSTSWQIQGVKKLSFSDILN